MYAMLYTALLSFFLLSSVEAKNALAARQASNSANLDSCVASSPGVTTLTSSSSGYGNASLAYNRRLSYFPSAIVYPSTPQAVETIIKCAIGQNAPVVARSGGHSYAAYGLGGQDGALVIDMSDLTSITVDNSTGIAAVQPGNRLGDMALALWSQGQRALPHGTCSYVGAGGHAAYGGYGLWSRSAGLLLDRMVSADLVLANGTAITVSNSSSPDIFWAVKGAAPSFGIVTSYYFQTLAAPPNTVNYQITWPAAISAANAVPILEAFQTFAFSNPTEQLSVLCFISSDHAGGLSISLSGSFFGAEADFTTAITPLTSSLPEGPTLKSNSYNWIDGLTNIMGNLSTAGKPDTPDDFYAKSILANTQFSSTALTNWVSFMTTNGSSTDLSWWAQADLYGGAISSVPENATSYSHRDSIINIQFYGYSSTGTFPDDGIAFMDGLVSALDPNPYAAYPNYVDPNLTPDQWHNLYYGSNYQRLTQIKREVDPNNLFSFPQSIEVQGANGTSAGAATGSSSSSSHSAAQSLIHGKRTLSLVFSSLFTLCLSIVFALAAAI